MAFIMTFLLYVVSQKTAGFYMLGNINADWLIDLLIDHLIDQLIDWLIHSFILDLLYDFWATVW